jgi:hypothetical protein
MVDQGVDRKRVVPLIDSELPHHRPKSRGIIRSLAKILEHPSCGHAVKQLTVLLQSLLCLTKPGGRVEYALALDHRGEKILRRARMKMAAVGSAL